MLISCNPFNENKALEYESELDDLVKKLEKYENGIYDRDELDEFIIADIRDLDVDYVVINKGNKNPDYSGFIEENDSLIILIKKSNDMFEKENRLIYDFYKKPRNFGSNNIELASYRLVQLNERWYFSEVGFD